LAIHDRGRNHYGAGFMVFEKSRTVTETEVNLARQDAGMERFSSSPIARSVVRSAVSINSTLKKLFPQVCRKR